MDPNSAIDPVKLGTVAAALTVPVSTPKAGNSADGQFQKLLDQYAKAEEKPAQAQSTAGKDQNTAEDRTVYTEKDVQEYHEDDGKPQDDPLEQMKKLAEYGYALARPEGSLGVLTLNGQEYQNDQYYIGWKDDYCVVIPDAGLDPEQLDEILKGQAQIFEEGDDLSGVLVKYDDPQNKDAGVQLTQEQLSAGEPVVASAADTAVAPEVKEQPVEQRPVEQRPVEQQPAEHQPVEHQLVEQQLSEPKEEEEVKVTVPGGEHIQTVFRNLQSAPIKVGDNFSTDQVKAEDVNSQIAQKVIPAVEQGQNRVELQLTPETLGTVKVEIVQRENGGLYIAISAQNSQARGLLEKNAGSLQAMLAGRAQAPVQVEVREESQPEQAYDGHNGNPSQQQQQQQEKQSGHAQSSQDFLHQLRLGLVEETEGES